MNKTRTPQQQQLVNQLVEQFNIEGDKILFLNNSNPLEPWLNYDALESIARQSGKFRDIEEHYITYIEPLRQVVHSATVVDPEGRSYVRSGVAKLGETLEGEGNIDELDEHKLAAARALNAALRAAGFNPLRAGSVVLDLKLPPREHAAADEADSRRNDLARIHMLAAQKSLIVPSQDDPSRNDLTGYRDFLREHFDGATTTAGMGAADRARVINALTEYDPIAAAA